jgi:hypothetical protein
MDIKITGNFPESEAYVHYGPEAFLRTQRGRDKSRPYRLTYSFCRGAIYVPCRPVQLSLMLNGLFENRNTLVKETMTKTQKIFVKIKISYSLL